MAPVAYIEQIRRLYANEPPYQWTVNLASPWSAMIKPVRECRIALISSGGIYHKSQEPFNPVKNDHTFREIPKTVDPADLYISHYSKNARDVKDLNTIFPLERFRELETQRVIGELAPPPLPLWGGSSRGPDSRKRWRRISSGGCERCVLMRPAWFRSDSYAISPWDCSPALSRRPAYRRSCYRLPLILPPRSSRPALSLSTFRSDIRPASLLILKDSPGFCSMRFIYSKRRPLRGPLSSFPTNGTSAIRWIPGKRKRCATLRWSNPPS